MTNDEYTMVRLRTSDRSPWSFYGMIVAESCANDVFPWANHGHDITVYKLADGGYAVLLKFWSHSQDEPVFLSVHRLAMHSLNWFLLNYDARLDCHSNRKFVNLSPQEKYELQAQFDEQVTDILTQLDSRTRVPMPS